MKEKWKICLYTACEMQARAWLGAATGCLTSSTAGLEYRRGRGQLWCRESPGPGNLHGQHCERGNVKTSCLAKYQELCWERQQCCGTGDKHQEPTGLEGVDEFTRQHLFCHLPFSLRDFWGRTGDTFPQGRTLHAPALAEHSRVSKVMSVAQVNFTAACFSVVGYHPCFPVAEDRGFSLM